MGRTRPRLVTPIKGKRSKGKAVAAWWKAHTGEELMDWQKLVLAGTLAHDARGQWQHRYALWTVARQNGKSKTLEALACWWLTEHAATVGPQVVTLTTHIQVLTTKIFERIHAVLEAGDYLAPRGTGRKASSWSRGSQELRTTTGSTLIVTSANEQAGHGLSVDLAIVDELWQIGEDVVYQGLMPTQRARKNPLMVMSSTAGEERSVLFKKWRETALEDIDKGGSETLWYAEWSPPPDVDIYDEQWWRWANPALGTTVTLEAMRISAQQPNKAAFKRADLNLWVPSAASWLDPGVWESAAHPDRTLADGGIVVADGSKDGSRWWALRAATDDYGIGVEVACSAASEVELWAKLSELGAANRRLQLRVGVTLASHAPPELASRIGLHGSRENSWWTRSAKNAIDQGQVWHHGEHVLSDQVCRAVPWLSETGMGLPVNRQAGDITLARCLVVAVGELMKRESTSRAMVVGASAPGP